MTDNLKDLDIKSFLDVHYDTSKEWDETTTEITVKKYCPHQHRQVVISTNPFKNECEECYKYFIEEHDKQRMA